MGQGNRTGVISEGGHRMGLVKTRRLAVMQKQQRAKAGMPIFLKGEFGNGAQSPSRKLTRGNR